MLSEPSSKQHYIIAGVLIFVLFYLFISPTSPSFETTLDLSYDPQKEVAWAIPVGGRTRREELLNGIVETLITGGVSPNDIYIFEDQLGRPNQQPDSLVDSVATKWGVRAIRTKIPRNSPETGKSFGIYLARHIHFMLDYLFYGYAYGHGSSHPPPSKDHVHEINRSYKFAVVIEDDLKLARDTVHYFHYMSRVMNSDPTLYCVSAHQDNAFYATSLEPLPSTSVLNPLDFQFRRGNHFMAPGWMTSAAVYKNIVRDRWLDVETGNYKYFNKFRLVNGHWDRFFDSQTGDMECIFPEIPRIVHMGAGGFTVEKKAQLELYENLRLASLDPAVQYGSLRDLSAEGYDKNIVAFLKSSQFVHVLEEIGNYRYMRLAVLINAEHDADVTWNNVMNDFFGLIGVGGYGGWAGYAKLRGVHKGTVFVRWQSNLVLLVAKYSPYMEYLPASKPNGVFQNDIEYVGCYDDRIDRRSLPTRILWYRKPSITPHKCLTSCVLRGFRYGGVQNGDECWCGDSLDGIPTKDESECTHECPSAGFFGPSDDVSTANLNPPCGGDFRNSVYRSKRIATVDATSPPAGILYVVGEPGNSCHQTCNEHKLTEAELELLKTQPGFRAELEKNPLICEEWMLAYLNENCKALQSMFPCKTCSRPEMEWGMTSPGYLIEKEECYMSKGMWLRCDTTPPENTKERFQRACACRLST